MDIPDGLSEEHIRNNYSTGDVLFWEDYPGEEKDKDAYFVILTKCVNESFYAIRGTSKTELYKPNEKRYNREVVFIKKSETKIFSKKTALDLAWFKVLSLKDMSKLLGKYLTKKGSLPDKTVKKLKKGIKNSKTIPKENLNKILNNFNI